MSRRPAIRRSPPPPNSSACSTSATTASCAAATIFHRISPGYCDGLKVDGHGHVWASAADGVHCLTPQGEMIGKIRIPYRVSNLCFGGRARNRLFIGGSHNLYAIFLNTRGAVAY